MKDITNLTARLRHTELADETSHEAANELERLNRTVASLTDYVQHAPICRAYSLRDLNDQHCDCGLKELLESLNT